MERERFEILSATMLHLVRAVQEIKAQKMAAYGLKGRSAAVLCRIFEHGGALSATDLVRVCEVDKAQISRCLAELGACGFVEREDDGVRRYKQKYRLSAAGTHAAADISRAFADIERSVSKNLTAAELEVFFRTLYTLCDNFDELLLKYR
ncbi:MAG: MarR family transcriptional regulator [Ruminococcaceae bacterium]|nr:MarR family transcriptional regulator [Oscillospiraceae bacterium]